MKTMAGLASILFFALTVTALFPSPLPAQEEEKQTGWSDKAELSFVATSGNAESTSLGFANTLLRQWENALFSLKAAGVQVETTTITRSAFAPDPGDLTSFFFRKEKTTETTAENYYVIGRYDRNISDRFFWYSGATWDRNVPAGIQNRYIVMGGVGNTWRDTEELKFKTDYAVTYTDQEDVVDNPAISDTYMGFRFTWEYLNQFGKSTVYTNNLFFNENLDETSDWRADMTNAVSVTMTETLALKVSLIWLYDNEPSFELVPLFTPTVPPDPLNPETDTGEVRPVQLDELDTIFSVALVADF
jgi:putative salt-induced outer membrane protein YdiY